MISKNGFRIAAAAVALALSSGAFAATTVTASAPGTSDIFLVVNDTTNNTSFLYDTGQNAAAFTGNTTLTWGVNSSIYSEFVAQQGGSDAITYSVLGGYQPDSSTDTVLYTAQSAGSATTGHLLAGAWTQLSTLLGQTNLVVQAYNGSTLIADSSSTAEWSGVLPAGWAASGNEATFVGDLKLTSDNQSLGNSLGFYLSSSSALTNSLTKNVSPSTFAGSFDFTGGVLTYTTTASSVPLPTPLLLILSGLGFMGAVSRRGRSASGDAVVA